VLDPLCDDSQLVWLDSDLDGIVDDSLASNKNLQRHFQEWKKVRPSSRDAVRRKAKIKTGLDKCVTLLRQL